MHQGGGVAAPVGGQIFREILPYLEVNKGNEEEVEVKKEVEVPDVTGKTLKEGEKILKDAGLEMVFNSQDEVNKEEYIITTQSPQKGIKINEGNKVYVE